MTTVYLLTDGPDDNERNVIGVFSSIEKLETAMSVFETYGGNHGTLYHEEFEIDDLERFIPALLGEIAAGYRIYHLSRYVQNPDYPPTWTIYPMTPYEYKYEKDEAFAFRISGPLLQSATVRASSEDEAIKIAERMLKEQTT